MTERIDEPEAREDVEEAPEGAGADGTELAGEGDLAQELERTRAAYARAAADYQNLQRRSREERAELTRLTMKSLVLNYLPVLDDLERALESVSDHEEILDHPWVEGVRMVHRKFLGVLEAAGVREIEAGPGVPFDPALHEAVAQQPGPLDEVIAVIRGGYAIDTMVVRPAMVVVGNGEEAVAPSADATG